MRSRSRAHRPSSDCLASCVMRRSARGALRERRGRRLVDGRRRGIDRDAVLVARALDRHVLVDDVREHRLRIALERSPQPPPPPEWLTRTSEGAIASYTIPVLSSAIGSGAEEDVTGVSVVAAGHSPRRCFRLLHERQRRSVGEELVRALEAEPAAVAAGAAGVLEERVILDEQRRLRLEHLDRVVAATGLRHVHQAVVAVAAGVRAEADRLRWTTRATPCPSAGARRRP